MQNKKDLMTKIEKLETILSNNFDITPLDQLKKDFSELDFNVICLGDFNIGKTTFIQNYFLKEQVKLPIAPIPETAKIMTISYDKKEEYVVLQKDGFKEISKNELKKYNEDKNNTIQIDIKYPLEILKNGVNIIDSPGLNDPDQKRSQLTEEYLEHTDSIIFMTSAENVLKGNEIKFLKEKILSKDLFEKVFIIINYWDTLDTDEQIEVLEYVKDEIENLTSEYGYDEIPIIPISAEKKLNFDILDKQLKPYIESKTTQDIIKQKIKKINTVIDSYIEQIDVQIKSIKNDNIFKEKNKLNEKIKELKQQKETLENKLITNISDEYDNYVNKLEMIYSDIVDNMEENIKTQVPNIKDKEDFEIIFKRAHSKAKRKHKNEINTTLTNFINNIENNINKITTTSGININNNLINPQINPTNKTSVTTTLTTASSIALLGYATTSYLTSQGIVSTISAAIFGAAAAPIIAGVGGVVLGVIAFKKLREYDEIKLHTKIEENILNIEKEYEKQIKELRDNKEEALKEIAKNMISHLEQTLQAEEEKLNEIEEKQKKPQEEIKKLENIKSELIKQKVNINE